jgi:hypothetical protein
VSGKIVQISVSSGGIPKTAVREARVIALGLDGDAHRKVELLGGPQIARYTSPCVNITRSFKDNDFARVVQKRHPGWSRVYARVLMEGSISHNDPVRLLDEVEAADVTVVAR